MTLLRLLIALYQGNESRKAITGRYAFLPLFGLAEAEEVVCSWKLSHQCCENCVVSVHVVELPHPSKIGRGEALQIRNLCNQPTRQFLHHPFTPAGLRGLARKMCVHHPGWGSCRRNSGLRPHLYPRKGSDRPGAPSFIQCSRA